LDQIADVGVLKLNSREIFFDVYSNLCDHGTWTSQRVRQTDRRHTVA